MPTTLTSKGQVTIPKPLREYLGLKAGSSVTFERLENGGVVLRPAKTRAARPTTAFVKLRGRATLRMSTEDILALTRGT